MEDRLRVGVITSPHGLKGEVKVFSTTDDLDRFNDLGKCYLTNGKQTIETECVSCKFFKNMAILKFHGMNKIEDVENLRQFDILVDRDDAVELEDDEFFICDIIGADVFDVEGCKLGTLHDVLETPAHQILVVKHEADGKLDYVPLVDEWVEDVDVENFRVTIIPHQVMPD